MTNIYETSIPWVTVKIAQEGDTKFVTVISTIHVNKRTKLSHCYADSWSDAEILNDIDLSPWR